MMFTSFFSNKPDGQGLGLLVCRTIVTSRGGGIWVQNGKTGGAILQCNLPLTGGSKP